MEDFYFSPTAKLADLVLPSSDWAERCTYNEEIDGNMILTFDQAVEAPGECWDDWRFFPGMGQAHRSRALVVERREGHGLWRLKEFYGYDLTWNEFQSTNVRSTEPGSENREIKKGVVAVPRPLARRMPRARASRIRTEQGQRQHPRSFHPAEPVTERRRCARRCARSRWEEVICNEEESKRRRHCLAARPR